MTFRVKFSEQGGSFRARFGAVQTASDGGFDRGYAEGYEKGNADGYGEGNAEGVEQGYADALSKRTDLVITENGEYFPDDDSTGFKSVKAQVASKFLSLVEGSLIEFTANDLFGAKTIRSRGFYQLGSLKSVEIPSTVNTIEDYAFYLSSSLSDFLFSANSTISKIGYMAIGETNIEEIEIPASVQEISSLAFTTNRNLKRFVVKSKTPPVAGANMFRNCGKLSEIVVPLGSGESYKSATNWSQYADKIVEGDV